MARKLRVWVDPKVCVGNAMCEAIAASVFRLNENRQSEVVDPAGDTVEKILEPGEELPKTWPVAGTTGYDAMREVNGVFIDHDHEPAFTALYQVLTGDHGTIADPIGGDHDGAGDFDFLLQGRGHRSLWG